MITEKEVAKVQDKQMKVKIRAHPQFNRDITGNVYKKRESFLKNKECEQEQRLLETLSIS